MNEAQREQTDAVLLRSWLWLEAKKRVAPEPEPAADVIAALRAQVVGEVVIGALVPEAEAIGMLHALIADRVGWTQPE